MVMQQFPYERLQDVVHPNSLPPSPAPSIPAPSIPAPSSLAPSSSRSPVEQEESSDLTSDLNLHQAVVIEEQQILHLVSCPWIEFLELGPPPSGYYDYIDGLVVYCPNMANTEHNELGKAHGTILERSESNLYVYSTPTLEVISNNGQKEWTVDKEDLSKAPGESSSAKKANKRPPLGMRHPDYSIMTTKRDSAGSSSVRDPAVVRRTQHPYPYSSKLRGVAEITSLSTRKVDLYTKWAAYARSELPLYVIFDRGTASRSKHVIVGALKKFSDAEKSWHGDPSEPTESRPDNAPTYYKKVYKPNDIVDCPIFSILKLTAGDLLDMTKMKNMSKEMYHDQSSQRSRAEKEKQARESAEKRAEKEKQARESAEKRAEKEKQARESAEKRAEKEKQAREKERKARESAEKRAEGLERELNELKRRGSQKKQERDETYAGGNAGAGSSSNSPTKSPKHKKNRENK